MMLESYEKIIVNLRESITKTTCDKYIFHLPIITAFKNSFFQSADTVEELKDLFFKTLFVSDKDNLKIMDDKDLTRVRASIYKIINDAETSEELFIQLLDYFKLKQLEPFSAKLSYFGSHSDLLNNEAYFPTLIRENFRIWMYGFNIKDRVNLGNRPIELLEALKFQEFLTLPCNYLYD